MSNLSRSFIRGFGGFLGVMAAKKTVELLTPGGERITREIQITEEIPEVHKFKKKLTIPQRIFTVVFWITGCALLFNLVGSIPGAIFFLFGWMIPGIFIKGEYSKEDLKLMEEAEELKRKYVLEINELIEKIEKFPVNTGLSLVTKIEGGRAETITKRVDESFDTQWLHKILISKRRIMNVLNNFSERYDNETIEKITSSTPWIGMTERQLMDMRNYDANYLTSYIGNSVKTDDPTNIETDVTKTGKEKRTIIWGNKYSGDVFKFEDGVLVSFKDR